MNEFIQLQPLEVVAERPFTEAHKSHVDARMMQFMVNRLRNILLNSNDFDPDIVPVKINLSDADGDHRIILVDWQYLGGGHDITAVGFFGQARNDIDHAPIIALENELINQLPDSPGILGYYNLRFPSGQWGNLVMCQDDAAKENWRNGATHRRAVDEYTPRHYHSLRLHNGLIPGGLMSYRKFVLTRTKYFDYDDVEIWRAVREFNM
jgi:hypothetical protein